MSKIGLFISATFDAKHKECSFEEASYRLRNDVRTKILGDVKYFLNKPKKDRHLSYNEEIVYKGGYYFYDDLKGDTFESCNQIVEMQLKEIDSSDLVIVILDRPSAIATISELLYASYKNKEIVIFADPNICKLDINSKYWYTIEMCKTFNDNITFINYTSVEEIMDYLKNYKKSKVKKPLKKINSVSNTNNLQKIFISCHYDFSHSKVNKENISVLAQNDIRSKLVGDARAATFENDNTYLKHNKNLKYVGGFYYYYLVGDRNEDNLKEYQMKSKSMINRLKETDIICSILNNYECYGVVSEFLYGSFLNKKVFIYYYKEITDFIKNKEYWFPILIASKINSNTTFIEVKNEKDIIKRIENINNEHFA